MDNSKPLTNYESAICALNGLQSNVAVLNLLKQKRQLKPEANLLESLSDLDRLNIIHVVGTKGKGSVCAMTESILRHHGLKTGFYSSPHLIHVCERIRIDGQPLFEEKFATYFWQIYDKLMATKVIEVKNTSQNLQSLPLLQELK